MPKSNSKNSKNSVLLAVDGVLLCAGDTSDDNDTRTFSGVANSGKPFSQWGEQSIIDLDDIEHKKNIAVLDLHDRSKRAGVAQLSVSSKGLEINGRLLSNEHGKAIADDADEGFPFELSVHAQSGSVEYVKAGESVDVNGKKYKGPIRVMRKCKIREVSLTPTGVDDKTNATILSDDLDALDDANNAQLTATESTQSKTKTNGKEKAMTLEQALEKIKTLEAEKKALADENKTLKAGTKKAKTDSKLSAKGFALGDDGKFNNLSEASYSVLLSIEDDAQQDAMIADMAPREVKKQVPGELLGETTPPANGDVGDVQLSDNPLLADAESRQ